MPDLEAKVLQCPNCGAPLVAPSKFARQVKCTFCAATVEIDPGAVSAKRFRDALAEWDAPATHGIDGAWNIAGGHWDVGRALGRGDASDVFVADRARWPTERVVLKVLRDAKEKPRHDREWEVLERLQSSEAAGAAHFTRLVPAPVFRGRIENGPRAGAHAIALRWAPGFRHTLEDARRAHPAGVDPPIGIWLWRRILEILSFVSASGVTHGDLSPAHVLVEEGEHGIRLVGWGRGPRSPDSRDVRDSARVIAFALGGDGPGTLPSRVPGPFAALVREVAAAEAADAWALRQRIGELGRTLFGPPAYHPLEMPDRRLV